MINLTWFEHVSQTIGCVFIVSVDSAERGGGWRGGGVEGWRFINIITIQNITTICFC